ncbi:MAG: hypothetical protein ABIE42_00035 [Candidatus Eisenbacteria bacterium]
MRCLSVIVALAIVLGWGCASVPEPLPDEQYWPMVVNPPLPIRSSDPCSGDFVDVPEYAIRAASDYVVGRLGECASSYVVALIAEDSHRTEPNEYCPDVPILHLMSFELRNEARSAIHWRVHVDSDEDGEVLPASSSRGALPDEREWPGFYNFPVDREQALSIAQDDGLEGPFDRATVEFLYYPFVGTFVWVVDNSAVASGHGSTRSYRMISASSGNVIGDGRGLYPPRLADWEYRALPSN